MTNKKTENYSHNSCHRRNIFFPLVHITFSLYFWPIDVAFSRRIVNLTKEVIVPVILCLHMDVRLFNCFYYLKDEINILTVAK